MTGTFKITSSTKNSQFEYSNAKMIIQGNFTKNIATDALQDISASCYRKNDKGEQDESIGNFNGYCRGDGEIKYSMSEMSRNDANSLWDAIDEIEPEILKTAEE